MWSSVIIGLYRFTRYMIGHEANTDTGPTGHKAYRHGADRRRSRRTRGRQDTKPTGHGLTIKETIDNIHHNIHHNVHHNVHHIHGYRSKILCGNPSVNGTHLILIFLKWLKGTLGYIGRLPPDVFRPLTPLPLAPYIENSTACNIYKAHSREVFLQVLL